MSESFPRPTRRERVEAMEAAIADAALEEFLEHGSQGVRIAGIARRAGVAEGTIYLYHRNKDAIFSGVLRRFFERLTREAAAVVAEQSGATRRLDAMARHHLRHVSRVWPLFALATSRTRFSEDYRSSETYALQRAYAAVFDGVIRDGQAMGEIRSDLPLTSLRDLFFGGLEFACRTALLRGETGAEAAAPGLLAAFLEGAVPRHADDPDGLSETVLRLERAAERLERAAAANEAAARADPREETP